MVILNNSKEGKNFCTKGTSIGAHRKKILRNRKIRKHRETVVEKKGKKEGLTCLTLKNLLLFMVYIWKKQKTKMDKGVALYD